jgi:hypothetical protein
MKRTGWGTLLGMGCALMFAACGAGPEEDDSLDLEGTESVRMRISLAGDPCGVAYADATVYGQGMPTIGPKPLNVSNGYIDGFISGVPAGPRRVVDVRAYNPAGREVYAGSVPVDVYAGMTTPAELILFRNTQNCPNGAGTGDIYIIGVLEGARPDAGVDAGVDAGFDGGFDAGADGGRDGGPAFDGGVFDAGTAFDAGYWPRP